MQRYGGMPPYSETQHYVIRVLRAWNELRSAVHLPRSVWNAEAAPHPHAADIDYWLDDGR